jgi:hypothetical protein
MQKLIITGKLPCTKEECATLASIELRILELYYSKIITEEEEEEGNNDNNSLNTDGIIKNKEDIEELNKKSTKKEEEEDKTIKLKDHKTLELIELKPIIESKEDKEAETLNNEDPKPEGDDILPKTKIIKHRSISTMSNYNLKTNKNKNKMPVLSRGTNETLYFYIRSCSCFNYTRTIPRVISLKHLVSPNYKKAKDMMKLIKNQKAELSKLDFYNDEAKLKEYYAKFCMNLNCFGCVLFTVKEIVYDYDDSNPNSFGYTFKKVKRLLAINPNNILLIDYKTKILIKSQRMADLKSWFSGDGYYNLTPLFMHSPSIVTNHRMSYNSDNASHKDSIHFRNNNQQQQQQQQNPHQSPSIALASMLRFNQKSIDMNKLFVIEFRNCKWHLQIDDFHSLKSITCILLDQSLDMGIDSNPLMLDLTISEHFQNRYKVFSPNNSPNNGGHFKSPTSSKAKRSTAASLKSNLISTTNNLAINKLNTHNPSMALKNKSVCIDPINSNNSSNRKDLHLQSNSIVSHCNNITNVTISNDMIEEKKSKSSIIPAMFHHPASFGVNGPNDTNNPQTVTPTPTTAAISNNTICSSSINNKTNMTLSQTYKYEQEFQELQMILLWFPEEVAIRLTDVEYELFKQVHPSEYLRHATLDMNNHKSSLIAEASANRARNEILSTMSSSLDCNTLNASLDTDNSLIIEQPKVSRSVQDLINRYKEVSSWIKKLIQSQPSLDQRLAIILSAIRCAITCWNIGNFNSSREIWLGLKTALVNQSEDIPGMQFLNSAFDSSTFVRTNYTYVHSSLATTFNDKYQQNQLNQTISKRSASKPSSAKSSIAAKSRHNTLLRQFTNRELNVSSLNSSIGAKSIDEMNTNVNSNNQTSNNNSNTHPNMSSIDNHINSSIALNNIKNTTSLDSSKAISINNSGSFVINRNKSSISTNNSNSTRNYLDNRGFLLQSSSNPAERRAFCSKTQMYCEAVSRALDIKKCKVVPFFGAFLHDLKFIIDSVPSLGTFSSSLQDSQKIKVTKNINLKLLK